MQANPTSKIFTKEKQFYFAQLFGLDVPDCKPVWFERDAMTSNIMGLHKIAKKYKVTYDSAVKDAFLVHVAPKKTIKFACNESKLYVYKPKHYVLDGQVDVE